MSSPDQFAKLADAAENAATASMLERSASPALTVAVTTKGGGLINQHFGHAREFHIYRVDEAGVTFLGLRAIDQQYCRGGFAETSRLSGVIALIDDVSVLLCAKIGDSPREELIQAGIEASDAYAHERIEPSIAALYASRTDHGETPSTDNDNSNA